MDVRDSIVTGDDGELRKSARHFAEAVRALDPSARFTGSSRAAISAVDSRIPLTEALRDWHAFLSPAAPVEINKLGNFRRIYSLEGLVESQLGYRWAIRQSDGQRMRESEWADEWLVIGDDGADPLIADTSQPATPILWDMHGMGSWSPIPIAPSLAAYLEAEARWIEVCLLQTGAAQIRHWPSASERIWEDGGSYRSDIAAALTEALEPIVRAECFPGWGL